MSADPVVSSNEAACDKCEEIRLTKELEARESVLAAGRVVELEREKSRLGMKAADAAAEIASEVLLHTSVSEIAKESIERSRDSAKYIQTAAAAIAALYTGVLALVFSVTDNPLPARGVVAPLFLGLAIALATGYLAFVQKAPTTGFAPAAPSRPERAARRSEILTQYVNRTIFNKKWAIRASVISLGLGVTFVAAPFIAAQRPGPIPEAPSAPVIPEAVAPELVSQTEQLFEVQIDSFTSAVEARNDAIAKAARDSVSTMDRERTINVVTFILAGLGLIVVVISPVVYAASREGRSKQALSSTSTAPRSTVSS